LFATDPFAAILLVQGPPFLSAVALVWLERLGDRKLRKIAAIRLKLSLRADPLEEAEAYSTQTASFAALTGRALTIFRAGLALNIIGSPLNGFVPFRALVAGFLMTTSLANPGTRRPPAFLSSL